MYICIYVHCGIFKLLTIYLRQLIKLFMCKESTHTTDTIVPSSPSFSISLFDFCMAFFCGEVSINRCQSIWQINNTTSLSGHLCWIQDTFIHPKFHINFVHLILDVPLRFGLMEVNSWIGYLPFFEVLWCSSAVSKYPPLSASARNSFNIQITCIELERGRRGEDGKRAVTHRIKLSGNFRM